MSRFIIAPVNVIPIAGTIAEANAADQRATLVPYKIPHVTPEVTAHPIPFPAIKRIGFGIIFLPPISIFPMSPFPNIFETALSYNVSSQ